ncbi:MAG: nucleotidyl transferase AbiEii/AbiGii toxin family protein [Candidatus Micrarchaeia archaeon]|jgi:predicted nucleotidyltransferase component of viral defense system
MEKTKLFKLAEEVSKILPNQFYLAGGTSIMFKYNHRKSVDLDFFNEDFSFDYYVRKFKNYFKNRIKTIHIDKTSDNIDFVIDNVKISLVKFYFKNLMKKQKIKSIILASDEDLLLNKLYVITRRAEHKDLFDIYYLLKKHNYKINNIEELFKKKFGIPFDETLKYLIRFKDFNLSKKYSKKEQEEIQKFILGWVKGKKIV